jgi:hypothetical protein
MIYVADHRQELLDEVPKGFTRLHLNHLPLSETESRDDLAESQALIWFWHTQIWNNHSFIGLLAGSYPYKFPQSRSFSQLQEFRYMKHEPDLVFGPLPTCKLTNDFRKQAEDAHPGMGPLLDDVVHRNNFDYKGTGFYCNSFIAHSAIWKLFLPFWWKEFQIFEEQFDCGRKPYPFTCTCDNENVMAGYFLERVTCLWFMNKPWRITPL